jgi:hypothetical protein
MHRGRPAVLRLCWTVLALASWLPTEPAAAFALDQPFATACPACPGGVAIDVELSLIIAPRWNARPGGGGLADGLQVSIAPGIPAAVGVSDPVLAAKMEAAMVAGVLGWASPSVGFDITLGLPTSDTEIAIGAGFAPALGGNTEWFTAWDANRTFTNGDVVAGLIITDARIALNQDTLTLMFGSLGPSYALAALQRLVAHEVGHALGLDHPTDVYEYNIDSDSDPTNVLVVDFHDPFAGLIASPEVDATAIMVPYSDLPGLLYAFETPMHPDDLAGRDVLYPYLVPEPSVCALLAAAALVARRRYAS